MLDKGVKITMEEVKEFGTRADLFGLNGKGKPKIKILGNDVLFCTSWYRDGRKYTKEHSKTSIEAIFGRIERLYDKNGIVIARRLNKRSELLTTGKGECCRKQPASAQEIYTHISLHMP
ncbi:hypothetical protein [Staphylococcus aureus]|uniref:hypothetical protein n=1 Tax=Staphylococcus aureus TaxID=1280 RepID=UPI00025F4B9E|nr:hypothetical protein [Staphylococcus aureus]EIK28180.1 hypothetical protein MQU_02724 [Staphylococcus aureus subsp. aureus VRS11a]EIK28695.1 hypothetical protein MQW_02717 [Staphylococcus aureus subsp. aureus VRS11b]MCZ1328349.1 hypothetical protein [Enterococcus faecium]MCZ1551686.1 hypothetical protein [Enterococcus faecium]